MRKLLLGVLVGCAVGVAASMASGPATAAGGTVCGPKICHGNQECCVSPGPTTYQCVQPGHCRFN